MLVKQRKENACGSVTAVKISLIILFCLFSLWSRLYFVLWSRRAVSRPLRGDVGENPNEQEQPRAREFFTFTNGTFESAVFSMFGKKEAKTKFIFVSGKLLSV